MSGHVLLSMRSIHLHEELETEKAEELTLKLPREIWGLADIRRALQGVSDEEWFQDRGERMIALRLFGPERASTFKREFSNILGAIYGCLKVTLEAYLNWNICC